MTNPNNYFSDFMRSFGNQEAFANAMPKMDFTPFNHMIKTNAEFMANASKVLADNAQHTFKKISESAHNNVAQALDTTKEIFAAKNIEYAASHAQQYAKSAIENTVVNAQEIVDMQSKASIQVFQLMSKNFANNTENCSAATNPARKSN